MSKKSNQNDINGDINKNREKQENDLLGDNKSERGNEEEKEIIDVNNDKSTNRQTNGFPFNSNESQKDDEKTNNCMEINKSNDPSINDATNADNQIDSENDIACCNENVFIEKQDIAEHLKLPTENNENISGDVLYKEKDNKKNSDLTQGKLKTDIAQQNQEFKLELTLTINVNKNTNLTEIITLSRSSCPKAIAGLRKCSDFCYQVCSIREAIEQEKCSEASGCWSQLCEQFTWWESIKLTLYSLFMFRIAKLFKTSTSMEIKLFPPTQHNNSVLKTQQKNKEIRIPNSEIKNPSQNRQNQFNKTNLTKPI